MLVIWLRGLLIWALVAGSQVQLTSVNDNYLSLVSGLTSRMQCSVYRCTAEKPRVTWYKDDLLLFNGTEFIATSGLEPENVVLQQSSGRSGQSACLTDDYTLLLKNLTAQDSGRYRCEITALNQQLDFHLNVLDSGLKFGFNENVTFDYSECCVERGLSPLCRPMCKPRDMHLEFFDPTSCQTNDYRNFLNCVTDDGRRDYVPCCRRKNIPNFCFDFCTHNFQMLKRSHRLCLYYLPEIFECFSQTSSTTPEIPYGLHSWIDQTQRRRLCWKTTEPRNAGYTVHLREMVSQVPLNANFVGSKGRVRQIRSADVLIARHTTGSSQVQYLRLNPQSVEFSRSGEVCVYLDGLKKSARYVVYVQSNSESGTSEPSAALFTD